MDIFMEKKIEREQYVTALLKNLPKSLSAENDPFKINNLGCQLLKYALEYRVINQNLIGKNILFLQKKNNLNSQYLDNNFYNVTYLDNYPCNETAKFDTIVALDFELEKNNWNTVLQKWKALLKPNGRIILNSFSKNIFNNSRQSTPICLETLMQLANNNHLQINKTIPYAALVTGDGCNLHLNDLEKKNKWHTLMTWLTKEPELFNLALFLEEELIQKLTFTSTSRFFIVIENSEQASENSEYLTGELTKQKAMSSQNLFNIFNCNTNDFTNFSNVLNELLKPLKSKFMLYMLLQQLLKQYPTYNFNNVFNDFNLKFFVNMLNADEADTRALNICEKWMSHSKPILYKDVEVLKGSEFFLISHILMQHYNVYREN